MMVAQGRKIDSLDPGKWRRGGNRRYLCLSRRGKGVSPCPVLLWPVLLPAVKTAGSWRCSPIRFSLVPSPWPRRVYSMILNTVELLNFQRNHEHLLQVFQILNLPLWLSLSTFRSLFSPKMKSMQSFFFFFNEKLKLLAGAGHQILSVGWWSCHF